MLNRFTKKNTLELVCSVSVQDPNLENNSNISLSLAYTSSFSVSKVSAVLLAQQPPHPIPFTHQQILPSPPTPTNERTHARSRTDTKKKSREFCVAVYMPSPSTDCYRLCLGHRGFASPVSGPPSFPQCTRFAE